MDDKATLLAMINQCRKRDGSGVAMKIKDRFVAAHILWGRPVNIQTFDTREAAEKYASTAH